jgi:GT2 family glycosyltransferase
VGRVAGRPPRLITVVVATHDRRERLLATLPRLVGGGPVVVVDNGSTDGTAGAVRRSFPDVEVVRLPSNRGAAGRNVGVERARTPYVAFADDDSWWAPGALDRAAAVFDGDPSVGLVAGRILVGPAEWLDPTCPVMAATPRDLVGFVACGAVVRRSAFLAVGGFSPLLGTYGEETLLALDLAVAGWGRWYVDDVVAHHHPGSVAGRDPVARRRRERRNALLTAWLRRPAAVAVPATIAALGDPALLDALRLAPAALAGRRVIPPALERRLQSLA